MSQISETKVGHVVGDVRDVFSICSLSSYALRRYGGSEAPLGSLSPALGLQELLVL